MSPASYPPPLQGTPSWLSLLGGGSGEAGLGHPPGEGWPAIETIDYVTKFIVLLVLLLALPWLIGKLVTAPHEVKLAMGPASVGG